MGDIRGNFFYTRTVPCQLWFLDRATERDDKRKEPGPDARRAEYQPEVIARDLRLLAGAAKEHRRDHLALPGQAERFLKLVKS
jgi:type I restriction enzyme M protein